VENDQLLHPDCFFNAQLQDSRFGRTNLLSTEAGMPTVTVVVPVRNEARSLEQTLRGLLTQNFPSSDFEVIVADGGSTDETVPIVRRLQAEFSNLELLFNPRRLSSAARNLAVRHMIGDYAVIVDGHCNITDRDYLRHVVEAFEASGADCLGRPQPLNAPNPTSFQQAVSLARQSRLGHNPDSDIYSEVAKFVEPQNTAVAYSRKVFERIGLFDPAFDACEDVEFNQRVFEAGFQCYFTPKLKVLYHPRSNWSALFYQLGRYGSGRARLAVKNLRSLTLPALVPPFWLVWLAVAPLLALLVPPLGWLFLGSLICYTLVLFGAGLWLGRGQTLGVIARIPAVFVAIHAGFGWGFWKEIAKQMRLRWQGRRSIPSLRAIPAPLESRAASPPSPVVSHV
jgi:GT2 family glycosyltransferase